MFRIIVQSNIDEGLQIWEVTFRPIFLVNFKQSIYLVWQWQQFVVYHASKLTETRQGEVRPVRLRFSKYSKLSLSILFVTNRLTTLEAINTRDDLSEPHIQPRNLWRILSFRKEIANEGCVTVRQMIWVKTVKGILTWIYCSFQWRKYLSISCTASCLSFWRTSSRNEYYLLKKLSELTKTAFNVLFLKFTCQRQFHIHAKNKILNQQRDALHSVSLR